MTPEEFVAKWKRVGVKESASSQTHFNELCELLGVDKPLDIDPKGEFYTFDRTLEKSTGGRGFADVWYRDHFAWEYKGKEKDLSAAFRQLLTYREDLGNPPLLIVSDIDTIELHTNFTATQKEVRRFTLDDLLDPERRRLLKEAWENPETFNPAKRRVEVTEATVRSILANVAEKLKERGEAPDFVAHFLVKIVFTMFAEDAGLLPELMFTRLLKSAQKQPADFKPMAKQLFDLMSDGGLSPVGRILHFNGEIFRGGEAPSLQLGEIDTLLQAAGQDWTAIEPAIFGTLFERIIDPDKRAQAGAHYTPPPDIHDVIAPVILDPLRQEWDALRAEIDPSMRVRLEQERGSVQGELYQSAASEPEREAAISKLEAFLDRLGKIRVLDPACGSGNFLYLTMQALMDLESSVRAALRVLDPDRLPVPTRIHPRQFLGLELNRYAHEIAGMVLWIGYLQWLRAHDDPESPTLEVRHTPILEKLDGLQNVDALLDQDEPREWPEADFIVGNPPFLGSQPMRGRLGDDYVDTLREAFKGRLPRGVDLVCYWFELAREQLEAGRAKRVGLLATNSIRGGKNRKVLERIKASGDIFVAWSDREWIQDDAAVRVSIVGFDDGSTGARCLDGNSVREINSDLTSGVDLTKATKLRENVGKSFMGTTKAGPFDVDSETARVWLASPNPSGRSNAEVVKRWVNASDVARKPRNRWIVDFATMPLEEAAEYLVPFEYVKEHVKPLRMQNNREIYRERWWQHAEPRPALRKAIEELGRYLVTPRVSKHHVFVWLGPEILPDSTVIAIVAEDDYTFGVLHSRIHEVWSLRQGTSLGQGNDPRYTPSTCFETFPFPRPTQGQADEVAKLARHLDDLRSQLLEGDDRLTLTKLYNDLNDLRSHRDSSHRAYPLLIAHEKLDEAVAAAYGWKWPLEDEDILERLLALNLERAEAEK